MKLFSNSENRAKMRTTYSSHIFHFIFGSLLTLLASASVYAQNQSDVSHVPISEVIEKSLNFLSQSQISESEIYYPGEWTSVIHLKGLPGLAQVGKFNKTYDEPTAFLTSSIMNLLMDTLPMLQTIPNENTSFAIIKSMVSKAFPSLENYRVDNSYNFYPGTITESGIPLRQPKVLKVFKIWKGITHIPNDADTTSITYLAQKRANSIFSIPLPDFEMDPAIFDNFLDVNRTPHIHNKAIHMKETGAFMTWLLKESKTEMPKTFSNVKKGPRIPLGKNDVDCIVNSNVLRTKNYFKSYTEGTEKSCQLLKRMAIERKEKVCGVYYDNEFYLSYVIANLASEGLYCLNEMKEPLIAQIIKQQQPNGSWQNSASHRKDMVQSTAYALNVLISAGNRVPEEERAVQDGLKFLLSQAKSEGQLIHWKGEAFFTANPIFHNYIYWTSDAYTTALVIKTIAKAKHYLGKNEK